MWFNIAIDSDLTKHQYCWCCHWSSFTGCWIKTQPMAMSIFELLPIANWVYLQRRSSTPKSYTFQILAMVSFWFGLWFGERLNLFLYPWWVLDLHKLWPWSPILNNSFNLYWIIDRWYMIDCLEHLNPISKLWCQVFWSCRASLRFSCEVLCSVPALLFLKVPSTA